MAKAEDLNRSARLKEAAHRYSLPVFERPAGDTQMEVFIPKDADLRKLMVVAEQMAVRIINTEQEGLQRPVRSGDPEYVIPEATQRDWKIVSQSPLGCDVMQMMGETPDEARRRKHTLALGYVLQPEGSTTANVGLWLEHQKDMEGKNGLKPVTAIPNEWVRKTGLSNVGDPNNKKALQKAFARE